MIRKATMSDKSTVCDLILMASSCLFEDVLDTKDLIKQKELLMKYYEMKGTKYSLDNILVYEKDNQAVACLVLYDASNEANYIKNMEAILDNGYKYSLEGENNTIYIDTLAVDEKYQSIGISKELLKYAIDNTQKNLSLLVETYKKNVEEYYKRLGFKVLKNIDAFNCNLDVMLYEH